MQADIQVIMPTLISKYQGNIQYVIENTNNPYKATFKCNKKTTTQSFPVYDEAFAFIREKNQQENNIRVSNVIYKYENHYECHLTKDKYMKFDFINLALVQNYLWAYSKGYARCKQKSAKLHLPSSYFHLCITTKANNYDSDHINSILLDNRHCNLRYILRGASIVKRRASTTKAVGVHLRDNQRWVAQYRSNTGKLESKSFSVALYGYDGARDNAIRYRNEKISQIANYVEALNL